MRIIKNQKHKTTHLIITTVFILILFASSAFAGTVFLDGSATSCSNGSTNYNPSSRSCGNGSDTVFLTLPTFTSNIIPSTTNYMRAGSYFVDSGDRNIGSLHVPTNKSGTSGSPTIIKAYPGEERLVLIGTKTRGATYNSNPSDSTGAGSWNYYPNPALVTYNANYVIIDGVKVYGQTYLAGGHDVILQNSDCGGGGGTGTITTDQGNTIRFNNIYNVTLRNNKIHHNCRRVEDNNGSLIIGYAFSALIDQNTLVDGYGTYFEDKDGSGQTGRTTEVRYNLFGTSSISQINTVGIRGFNQAQYTSYQLIHHNIFLNKTIGINVIGSPAIDNIFYNNTFINCNTDINQPSSNIDGGKFSSYNNIFYHSSTGNSFIYLYSLLQLKGSEFNIYYGSGNWTINSSNTKTSLNDWKSFSGLDVNSISLNPNFVNASGTSASDFKRSSYVENFTGSLYSSHAGAYQTGAESIGFSFTDTTNPNPLSNPTPGLKVVN